MFPKVSLHLFRRFPMYAAFPRSEYYQRIRLRTAAFAFLGINPIVRHTRSALMRTKTTVDLPGPVMLPSPNVPCSLTPPQSPATSPFCGVPTGASQPLRCCRPAVKYLTRLNRFTFVTARASLCLRLVQFVASSDPRLDSR